MPGMRAFADTYEGLQDGRLEIRHVEYDSTSKVFTFFCRLTVDGVEYVHTLELSWHDQYKLVAGLMGWWAHREFSNVSVLYADDSTVHHPSLKLAGWIYSPQLTFWVD